jgi:stage II sporulation protein D (peptidoglycan lytic transglycosylase)
MMGQGAGTSAVSHAARGARAARRAAVACAFAAVLALLAASCATVPPPSGPPQPGGPEPQPGAPAPTPEPGVPAPGAPGAPQRLELTGEPEIDIGIAWDLDSVRVEPLVGTGVSLQLEGEQPKPLMRGNPGMVVVHRSGGGKAWAEVGGKQTRWPLERGDTLWLASSPSERSEHDRARWGNKTWRGTLKVFINPRGKLTLADRLPLETYLLGVVPGEIGALSDVLFEAGRAQAVAARSYTLFYRGRRADEGFDLYATVEDQLYSPVEAERPLATRCVQSTSGMVALSDGWPIRANYCSTCGGITAEVWEGWPTASLSYLTSRRDHEREKSVDYCAASPQYRWREEWTVREFASNLALYGPKFGVALPAGGVGEILDVAVQSRSRSGRVWRLDVRTTKGEIVVPAYCLRQVLRRAGNQAAITRSNLFKIDVRRDRAGKAISVVATGAGSGHGVGLCQTGALGMARVGKTGEQILRSYYTGIQLERLY